MKKVLIFVLTILIVSFSFSVSAAEKSKISDTLQNAMSETPANEKLEVHIWLYCQIDESEVFRQAVIECGYVNGLPLNMTLDEVYTYKVVYNRIVSELEAEVSNCFIKKLGVAEDDIVYLGKHPYVVLKLTKDQINEADTYDEVSLIDYANNAPVETPTYYNGDNQSDQLGNVKIYEERVKDIYPFLYNYDELYYHVDSEGVADWVLITGYTSSVIPQSLYMIIGNRVVIQAQRKTPFGHGYAVYDTKQNIVKSVYTDMLDQYEGLEEAFNKYGCGKLLGDLDDDNEITIIDVTIIQRCEVNIRDYPENDLIQPYGEVDDSLRYYSDFNRDGERDIIDATCIQRYLVGLSYPVE